MIQIHVSCGDVEPQRRRHRSFVQVREGERLNGSLQITIFCFEQKPKVLNCLLFLILIPFHSIPLQAKKTTQLSIFGISSVP